MSNENYKPLNSIDFDIPYACGAVHNITVEICQYQK